MFRTTTVCIACCVASGCMSFGGAYPLDWADAVKVDGESCPAIEGTFTNAGEMYHEESEGRYVEEPVSLVNLLSGWADPADKRLDFSAFDPAIDDYESVDLQLAGDTLRVSTRRKDGGYHAFDVPVRLECENSLMKLEPNWDASTIVLFSIVDRTSLQLGRASDGSLLVHSNSAGGVFVMYMPFMGGSDRRWIRFPAAQPQVAAAGSAEGA